MNEIDEKALVDLNMAIALCGAEIALGGPGSGNWAHVGRPGKRGGSASRSSGGMSIASGRDWQQRQAAARGGGKSALQQEFDSITSQMEKKNSELSEIRANRRAITARVFAEKDADKNKALKSELLTIIRAESAIKNEIKELDERIVAVKSEMARAAGGSKNVSDSAIIYDEDEYSDVYKKSLMVIDGVHGDGELEPIAIDTITDGAHLGSYTVVPAVDVSSIAVSSAGTHKEETLSHEVGHWLDHRALGDSSEFLSESYGSGERTPEKIAMSNVMRAITSTDAVRKLGQAVDDPERFAVKVVSNGGESYSVTPSEGMLNYYLSSTEMWARAYAQYIATRSGNSNMLAAINAQVSAKDYTQYSQWTAEDFEPIAEAIDELMEVKGWLR